MTLNTKSSFNSLKDDRKANFNNSHAWKYPIFSNISFFKPSGAVATPPPHCPWCPCILVKMAVAAIVLLKWLKWNHILPCSDITGGGWGVECPPQRLSTGKFLLTYREKRGKEKRERGEIWRRKEEGKLLKRKVEKLKMEGGKVEKWGEDFSFSFLFTFQNH